MPAPRAVVFAYHNVGVRLFLTLLAHGVEIAFLVTHQDDPKENVWFDSVARCAEERGIRVIKPQKVNTRSVIEEVAAAQPDFIFSFYYRQMLSDEILALAQRGAYNMHGSLLPKYRGRSPVNWAVLHGEQETGASLHEMVSKPDAGRLVAQERAPILPDDTALEVFDKVTVAAEICLDKALPGLLDGTAPHVAMDLHKGSYFGGRTPEDGQIDWSQPARHIHNLVRAVAPPYPGAFADIGERRLQVNRSLCLDEATTQPPGTLCQQGQCILAACGDARSLRIVDWSYAPLQMQNHGKQSV